MQNNQENQNDLIDNLIENDEKKQKEKEEQERKIKEAVKLVFDTEAGKYLGKWLYNACKIGESNNDINPNKLIYFKSREDLYNSLRKYMTKENIINIELGGFN